MGQTIITITNNETETDMKALVLAQAGDRFLQGKLLMNYLRGLMGGHRSAAVKIGVEATKAFGTFELDTVIATDAVKIAGIQFSCVASGASGNQFNVGQDDAETAENLAAAINESDDVNAFVVAEADGAIVTITAKNPGVLGNAITIESLDSTIVASGTHLENGSDGSTERTFYYGSAPAE